MKLAFHKKYAKSTPWYMKIAPSLIHIRLASKYHHGAIIIGDYMYHATTREGLHKSSGWDASEWDIIDVGIERDTEVLSLFDAHKGAKYDWFSLTAFVVPWRESDSKRLYCFEWCYWALTGYNPEFRVSPETLMAYILTQGK